MDYSKNNYQKNWALNVSETIYRKTMPMLQKEEIHSRPVPEDIQKKLLHIGELVKQTRLAYGMTQIDFAKQRGISKNSLQNLEYGKNVTLLSLFTVINEIYSPMEFFEDIE
jgi:DNA-binding XRE family transcriptional regulator